MTMDYTCLGRNEKMRARRYNVLNLFFINGATPEEVVKISEESVKIQSTTIDEVYNDIAYLRRTTLHDLPLDMIRDLGNSFYEIKMSELARKLKQNESNPSVWLGIQKLIKDYKDASLKLQGASNEKIEHVGDVSFSLKWSDNDDNNDPIQSTSSPKDIS